MYIYFFFKNFPIETKQRDRNYLFDLRSHVVSASASTHVYESPLLTGRGNCPARSGGLNGHYATFWVGCTRAGSDRG